MSDLPPPGFGPPGGNPVPHPAPPPPPSVALADVPADMPAPTPLALPTLEPPPAPPTLAPLAPLIPPTLTPLTPSSATPPSAEAPAPAAISFVPLTPPPPSPSGGSKEPSGGRGKFIAVGLVIAALIGVGIFVLTRSDDKAATSPSTLPGAFATTTTLPAVTDSTGTIATTATTVPAESTLPTASTLPSTVTIDPALTTVPAVSTVEPSGSTLPPATTLPDSTSTTLPFAVPDGAIDLGHQVYLPIPDGWTQTNKPGEVVVISDSAGSSASFQALARDAGEDITALAQEYTDTFDSDFAAVGFGPMRFVRQIDGPMPINQYGLFYTTYDAGDVTGIDGAISLFVRSDGLSLVYDSYTTVGLVPLPDAAYQGMLKSMLDAAPLGPTMTLVQHDPFRVTSVSPTIEVNGVVGFTATPGFNLVTQGGGHAQVDNGTEKVEVVSETAQPDTATLIATAETYLATTTAGTTFTTPTEDQPDVYGVTHGTLGWTGTYTDGTPAAGSIDYYLDPTSHDAYVLFRAWNATASTNEPFAAEGAFMRRSFYNSLTNIP